MNGIIRVFPERTSYTPDDALSGLAELESASVDTCVTSPPYFGLWDYGTGTWSGGNPDCNHAVSEIRTGMNLFESAASVRGGGHKVKEVDRILARNICPICSAIREDKQIGLEDTPEEYIERLVNVFRGVHRVLRNDGTLWVNIGDTYCSTALGSYTTPIHIKGMKEEAAQARARFRPKNPVGMNSKDLIGIPWMLAFALRADGWYLRQNIIWHKPNCMPESVTDRCTKSHEYIFLLSKSKHYYFNSDAIKEPAGVKGNAKSFRGGGAYVDGNSFYNKDLFDRATHGNTYNESGLRNKRDVWSVATKPFKDAHFATFPPELIHPCILAGCRKGGVVLDPFFGSGTTGLVAIEEQRGYIGIELSHEYVTMAHNRLGSSTIQYNMWA